MINQMEKLKLAVESNLPLLHITTDDPVNVGEVLAYILGVEVTPIALPDSITSDNVKFGKSSVYYTSSDCKAKARLYELCTNKEKTIIFVNTEKSVLQFGCGSLLPPISMVREFIAEVYEDPDTLLPAFGGMTMKDVAEVIRLTQTRDGNLSLRGVNETRRYFTELKGISQVDTDITYYVPQNNLEEWLEVNYHMFMTPVHPALTPRGLLLDGPAGTGKTMGAKYLASKFGMPLYRLDLGGLMGRYVGESEGNMMAALSQLDQVEPCVVIFDEVEKIFQSSSDNGVTSRLLSQLLWWLQEHKSKVFTVMTTNDVKRIPPELYREGRIDAVLSFLGVEVQSDGYEFARGALGSMLAGISAITLSDSIKAKGYSDLGQRVKSLYGDGHPVPQAKLTHVAHSIARELLSKGVAK